MPNDFALIRSSLVVLALALFVGCSSSPGAGTGTGGASGSGGSGSGGAAGGGSGGTPGNADTVVGAFAVRLIPAVPATNSPAFTAVVGRVDDGPTPEGVVMTVVEQANGCRLRTPSAPFCSPACGVSAVCTAGNKCVTHPKAQNLGTVKVRGLGSAEFSMEPISGNYQPPGEVELPNPPCAEGAEVTIETGGGAYPPFTVKAKGITELKVTGTGNIPLNLNQPLNLAWTPPGAASVSRIHVRVDISHHGGLKGEIDCDVPDNGALEIPATMVTKLINLGVAGFPTVYVTRESSGSTVIHPGKVNLEISSSVERPLQLAGVVSCNDDSECPPGKPCLGDRTCTK